MRCWAGQRGFWGACSPVACCAGASTPGCASGSCLRCRRRASARSGGNAVSSRTSILSRLRDAAPPPVPLPDLPLQGQRFEDPVGHFSQMLTGVGGRCERVPSTDLLSAAVAALPVVAVARRVASLVPEAHPG